MSIRKEKKDEKLQLSVTETELNAVKQQAEIEGITVSQLLRNLVRDSAKIMRHILVAHHPK